MPPRLKKNMGVFTLLCIIPFALLYLSSWDFSMYLFNHQKPSLCACHKCLTEGDQWLRELIILSPEPFLWKKHKISEAVFKRWMDLQWDTGSITLYNKIVDSLFEIFPPVPDVAQPGPDRCITCAVVGNSANLKGSHYGSQISFHNVVIRMNQGHTEGYEEDVGNKTTHHVMYPNSAKKLDNTTHLVFFPFKINDLQWLHKKFQPEVKSEDMIANKDLVMILNPAFMKYVNEVWLGKKSDNPSIGFLTVVLSLRMCDEVSVFGFGAYKDGNWNHYFENEEYDIIKQLHEKNKINFFKG